MSVSRSWGVYLLAAALCTGCQTQPGADSDAITPAASATPKENKDSPFFSPRRTPGIIFGGPSTDSG